jgi:hypothetical protein
MGSRISHSVCLLGNGVIWQSALFYECLVANQNEGEQPEARFPCRPRTRLAPGRGISIDHLCMMLLGQESIRDVILFPQLKPKT